MSAPDLRALYTLGLAEGDARKYLPEDINARLKRLLETKSATSEDDSWYENVWKPLIHTGKAAAEKVRDLDEEIRRLTTGNVSPEIIKLVKKRAAELFIEEAARELHKSTKATAESPIPPLITFRDRRKLPRRVKEWRIQDLQQVGHRVVLAAQFKAGKTTDVANLVRSLLDGEPFLDKYDVSPVDGVLMVMDFEMLEDDPGQLDDWYEDVGVKNDDRLVLYPMKGRASTFDITKNDIRAVWVAKLREAHICYLIIDCLRPVLDALGLSEHSEVGTFLVALDELLREAGIREAVVVHHMGHTMERARGDSRIQDWPDVTWKIVREKQDDERSPRFFSAYGRGVDVAEMRLTFNAKTKRLAVEGGCRKEQKSEKKNKKAEAALPVVLAYLKKHGKSDATGKEIEEAESIKESHHTRAAIRAAIQLGIERAQISPIEGAGKKGGDALRLPEM